MLAVNNNAMSFSDRSGGISRRRVIFNFSEVVPENERDPMLAEKIEGELAVVIRHLLTRFTYQDEAKDYFMSSKIRRSAVDKARR